MASPMVEGRLDPHKKAHFTLHVADSIADGEVGDYTSVKYNHKPAQSSSSRTTTITPNASSTDPYTLTLRDKRGADQDDVFVFTGQKTVPKKSYILLFDTAQQKATLEPLANAYTFNMATKNGVDTSSTYSKIYPRKQKDEGQDTATGADDLFADASRDDIDADPDADNPFDFRHFLSKEKAKQGDESEYNTASSPDYRGGTNSSLDTPKFTARKPAASVASRPKASAQPAAKPKKRKSPDPEPRRTAPKKQPPPTVRLERRATQQNTPTASTSTAAKPGRKPAQPPPSKIKSAEIVHSSDESDADADGEAEVEDYTYTSRPRRSPSPVDNRGTTPSSTSSSPTYNAGLEIEIEVPDERPNRPAPRSSALSSLGMGQSLGLGYAKSPSAGPISLASAANSTTNSPNPHGIRARNTQVGDDVIDFGDLGGVMPSDDEDADMDADDVDVEPMNIGSPAQRRTSGVAVEEGDADGEEEDPLVQAMMMGLAGGDSSEESEEE